MITTIQVTQNNRKRIQTLKQSLDLASAEDVIDHLFQVREDYKKFLHEIQDTLRDAKLNIHLRAVEERIKELK
jgi:hypothetical protein